MNRKQASRTITTILLAVVGILSGACRTSQSAVIPPTFPPTVLSTPTLQLDLLSTATTTAIEWDLVILSDSSLVGVGEHYAAYIEEDLHVTVRLHDLWKGSLSARGLLSNLRSDEKWRSVVRNAEVVVYFGNPVGTSTGDWSCVPRANYVRDCSLETFALYQETLEGAVKEILTLRNGAPTIIRATDFYVPVLRQWREAGLETECTQCLENMNEAVHQAAAAQNVPVAHVYDAFNGPNHDEDPRDKGYIQSDGIHTSDLGQQVIAGLLRDLGYEPLTSGSD